MWEAAKKAPRLFLSPEEFAEIAGVRREFVWRLLRENRLPHIRLGRLYRVSVAALGEGAALLEQDAQAKEVGSQ